VVVPSIRADCNHELTVSQEARARKERFGLLIKVENFGSISGVDYAKNGIFKDCD